MISVRQLPNSNIDPKTKDAKSTSVHVRLASPFSQFLLLHRAAGVQPLAVREGGGERDAVEMCSTASDRLGIVLRKYEMLSRRQCQSRTDSCELCWRFCMNLEQRTPLDTPRYNTRPVIKERRVYYCTYIGMRIVARRILELAFWRLNLATVRYQSEEFFLNLIRNFLNA